MSKSQSEINLIKQAYKSALQGINAGFSAARPGMNAEEIELIVGKRLMDEGMQPLPVVEVKYGGLISPSMQVRKETQDGDFLLIKLSGWLKSYPIELERVTVLGRPTAQQKDYLGHLVEAIDWMMHAVVPGRKMAFYPAESRGRLITPLFYILDLENKQVTTVNAGEPFTLLAGMVLFIAPSIKSPQFGTLSHSEMVVLTENGVEILI